MCFAARRRALPNAHGAGKVAGVKESGSSPANATPLVARQADVLRRLLDWDAQGLATALVTLVGIEGNSSRSPGTLMAVAADGRSVGSFSAGCIEAAIVEEAVQVIAAGAGRTVRYGVGSPYIDLRLPCGGGIDLCFTPGPCRAALAGAVARVERREPAILAVREGGVDAGPLDGTFALTLTPALRIIAYGQGEDLAVFARLAAFWGTEVEVVTPLDTLGEEVEALPVPLHALRSHSEVPAIASDAWTAHVFLFHDHDWEQALLPAALALDGFYHGAIGSRRTHHARLRMLEEAGTPEALVARLRGRIGLIASTRDPATLALSILAETVAAYRAIAPVVPAATVG